jgi:hypothetical protein
MAGIVIQLYRHKMNVICKCQNTKNAIRKINVLHVGYTLTSLLIYTECAEEILHQSILAKRIV